MPEDAPRPGTGCIVLDCGRPATLFVQVTDAAELEDQESSIAMCDEHASHWRDGDLG